MAYNELLADPNYEFLRPLVTGWVGKIEAALRSRGKWKEVADECSMFYAKSAAAMWDPQYGKKFWRNVKAPKFRLTINKAFELVAVFGPNLLWEVPHRTVQPKRKLEIPQELFQHDQQAMQFYQMLSQQAQQESAQDNLMANLLQMWLNYTPREQPGGGLMGHSELAVIDALVKGRGVLCTRPYTMPSSGRTLTGSFREPPENLLIDPDFNSIHDARWIAIKHVEPHWEVERRFKMPPGSLKDRSTLESSWNYGEINSAEGSGAHRAAGTTNDLVVWYEIFSKTGCGARMSGVQSTVKDHLERVVGDYAYIAICAACPYPLNCSTDALRKGATDDDVREKFSWPTPLWSDDRWPVEVLDFYPDPDSAWPIPPLAPALGELKFLNFLVPWLCNRIYSSSRDFWAILGQHTDHYRRYLQEGEDQTIIPTPVTAGADDVRKVISVLQQPETRMDAWRIVELVSEMFEKRTGLTEFAYGRNEGGTQDRTAETTQARARAVGVRPEHMQKKVVEWQSRTAGIEGFLARWFVTGEDVEPLLGKMGRFLWEQHIMATDVELVVRQMQYTVAAASIRRPNRDRDIDNLQQVLQTFAPAAQGYGQETGNYEPWNFLITKWAEYHDTDMDGAKLPPIQPNEQLQQMEQQKLELEQAKLQAELQGKQMDMQGKIIDLQGKQLQSQIKAAEGQQKLSLDAESHDQEMQQDAAVHLLNLLQDRREFEQTLQQQERLGKLKLELARKQSQQKQKASSDNGKAA